MHALGGVDCFFSLFHFKYPLLDSLAAVPRALGSSYPDAQPADVLPLIQSWEYPLLLRITMK